MRRDYDLYTPSYATPNKSSLQKSYINQEQDLVKQAFQAHNYTSLSKLPQRIQPQFRSSIDKRERFEEILDDVSRAATPQKRTRGFSDFEYIPERLPIDDEKRILELWTKKDVQPFLVRAVTPSTEAERFYPYLSSVEKDEFMNKKELPQKPFLAGSHIGANTVNRSQLGDIIKAMSSIISTDWPELEPNIVCTEEDLIVIHFNLEIGDSTTEEVEFLQQTLLSYMNHFANRYDAINRFTLSRATDVWNVRNEGLVMYTFKPPWLRRRPVSPTKQVPKENQMQIDNSYSFL